MSGRYADRIAVVYVHDEEYNDPSACCQLCEDNGGCAGMMTVHGGLCGLLYVGAGGEGYSCDFAFTYQTAGNVFPGQGLWVQEGCGRIVRE